MPWVAGGGGGGRMFFVLVWLLLAHYNLQKGMLFKDFNWQDCKRSQTGVSQKEVFIHRSILSPLL